MSHTISITALITELTIMVKKPKQHIVNVFKKICINAKKEKSFSISSENEMILLCLSISIPNEDS